MKAHPFSTKEIDTFMGLALKEAMMAEKEGEVPVGAVLVDSAGQVLARTHNCPIGTNDPTAHAEILALRQAAKNLSNYRLPGTYLFVTLEPCIMCAGGLIWARVAGVFFGASDPKQGAMGSVVDVNTLKGPNHRIATWGGIMKDECADILKDFFKKRRGK